MKHLLVIISVLLAFQLAHADNLSNDEVSQNNESVAQNAQSGGEYGNEFEVVQTQLTKSEMWINAKKWISSSFKDYKHTVDMEDKESGTIIIKFASSSSANGAAGVYLDCVINATLKIDIRDQKYRYTFSDVTYSLEPSHIIRNGDLSSWSVKMLEIAQSYLEVAEVIARKSSVDPSLKNDIINYKNTLDNTTKYKNEKDKKKDKVTKEYFKAETFYDIAKSIETSYDSMRSYIVSSLKDAMIFKDDF